MTEQIDTINVGGGQAADSTARNAIIVGFTLLYVLSPTETVISIARGSEKAEGFTLVVVFGLLAVSIILLGRPSVPSNVKV